MNLYIGNLAKEVTDEDLQNTFAEYGKVSSAKVIRDKFSNLSRGFGFVEMPSNSEADAAITEQQMIERYIIFVPEEGL